MTWLYRSGTGDLFDPDGELVATGYSGFGIGLNQPLLEAASNTGPIPCGRWSIGACYTSEHTGPLTLTLTPKGHDACGRTDFRIHGDNITHTASRGCIILNRDTRKLISESFDRELLVTP